MRSIKSIWSVGRFGFASLVICVVAVSWMAGMFLANAAAHPVCLPTAAIAPLTVAHVVEAPVNVISADVVKTKRLVVGEGDHKMVVQANEEQGYIGAWIYGKDETKCLTLFMQDKGQCFIGIHSQQKGKMGGCPIALSIDGKGEPYVQFVTKGKAFILGPKELIQLAETAKQQED